MDDLESERSYFPIKSVQQFLSAVDSHLSSKKHSEPNLAFLSLLFGYLEHELTVSRVTVSDCNSNVKLERPSADTTPLVDSTPEKNVIKLPKTDEKFPTLDFEIVQGLYEQFVLLMKANIDKSVEKFTTNSGCATKELCKSVSDLIWNGLLRSYHKDKAHIQSLFSYFTGRQLDCFGLAFVVVAACQALKYKDVHLAISGDHAWAACGKESKDMVETTWHGNSNEDKRGLSIEFASASQSWLYHGGKPVVCNRWMEFVALLISLNPSIDSHTDSFELQYIQQKLLYDMYKKGHLDRYPMALGALAEMQETCPLEDTKETSIEKIHAKAVHAVETVYNGFHVFPYCSQGHYFLRLGRHKDAIICWAKAAQAMARYNYVKDDEEIYKEMIDIANELLPQSLRSDPAIGDDHECYRSVVRFYDGICMWEEGSSTPIFHSWWARYFTIAIGRFSAEVRESFADDTDSTSPNNSSGDTTARRSSRSFSSPLASSGFQSPSSSSLSDESQSNVRASSTPESKLQLRSQKMKALKGILTSGKKLNAQAVGLLLTAQSQVHFVKRRSNVGEYAVEYGVSSKRPRKSRDIDS